MPLRKSAARESSPRRSRTPSSPTRGRRRPQPQGPADVAVEAAGGGPSAGRSATPSSRAQARFACPAPGAVVATSSLRRRAQILHRRPDLKLVDIRGNVDTDCASWTSRISTPSILAEAGLVRLGLGGTSPSSRPTWMLPAVGRGPRSGVPRPTTRRHGRIAEAERSATQQAVLAERMLRGLGGGCQVPIGAITSDDAGQLDAARRRAAAERQAAHSSARFGSVDQAEALGQEVAQESSPTRRRGIAQGDE